MTAHRTVTLSDGSVWEYDGVPHRIANPTVPRQVTFPWKRTHPSSNRGQIPVPAGPVTAADLRAIADVLDAVEREAQ